MKFIKFFSSPKKQLLVEIAIILAFKFLGLYLIVATLSFSEPLKDIMTGQTVAQHVLTNEAEQSDY